MKNSIKVQQYHEAKKFVGLYTTFKSENLNKNYLDKYIHD